MPTRRRFFSFYKYRSFTCACSLLVRAGNSTSYPCSGMGIAGQPQDGKRPFRSWPARFVSASALEVTVTSRTSRISCQYITLLQKMPHSLMEVEESVTRVTSSTFSSTDDAFLTLTATTDLRTARLCHPLRTIIFETMFTKPKCRHRSNTQWCCHQE